jgi:hypothetical protein
MASGSKLPTYKWSSFALAATIVVVTMGCFVWFDYSSHGSVDPLLPLVALWLIAFLTYHWHRLRSELARGVFSAERYEADPAKYFRGPVLPYALWLGVLIVAVVVRAILSDQ